MRRWLLDLHLYLGLICLPYVVLFGVSSLLLNHGLQRETTSEWSAQLAPLGDSEPSAQAAAALRALDLRGGVLAHTLKRGDSGELAFRAIRPGRSYQVAVAANGAVRVVERDSGVLGVVRDLHGASDTQGAVWNLGWALYTELATAVLLFSIVSGALLVLPRPSERAIALGSGALGILAIGVLAAAIW